MPLSEKKTDPQILQWRSENVSVGCGLQHLTHECEGSCQVLMPDQREMTERDDNDQCGRR